MVDGAAGAGADGSVWFKACAWVQGFEPRLTAGLFARWPDWVVEVIAHDPDRAWLLLADAGTPLRELGNRPASWLAVLPAYAELQRGEAARAGEHLAHAVPDLRLRTLPRWYEQLLDEHLPLSAEEAAQLRDFAPRYARLCAELAEYDVPDTVQHDDQHAGNIYIQGDRPRLLDWGDASISHPFASLVVTFRFLEEINGLPAHDPWYARLREAYLEPWAPAWPPRPSSRSRSERSRTCSPGPDTAPESPDPFQAPRMPAG